MERKYIFFNTAKAALFLFYALVLLFFSIFYAAQTLDIPRENLVGGIILYLPIVVFYSLSIDRPKRGLSQ
ncbi:MAG: hypothetical protein ACI9JM_002722 [Halioglobus sp.]|jgi:hypothetical protein